MVIQWIYITILLISLVTVVLSFVHSNIELKRLRKDRENFNNMLNAYFEKTAGIKKEAKTSQTEEKYRNLKNLVINGNSYKEADEYDVIVMDDDYYRSLEKGGKE